VATGPIGELLRARRERLLAEWEASARMLPPAINLDRLALLAQMPALFDHAIAWLEHGAAGDREAIEPLARQRADGRIGAGYALRQAVAEYRILRHGVLRLCAEDRGAVRHPERDGDPDPSGPGDLAAVARFDGAIDAAIDATIGRYSEVRERAAHERDLEFHRVLGTLPVAVWVADADGQLRYSNEAAQKVWGGNLLVSAAEFDRFRAWWPDGRRVKAAEWGLARALRNRELIVDEELQIEGFDGSRKVIRNAAAPILDEDGRLIGGVAVNEDITLLKRTEVARDLFLGILGHDLRSPLGAITMAASSLLRGKALGEAERRGLERIQASAARIHQLIDDLLDFTRARFGAGFPLEPAPVDMGEICCRIVDELRTAHPERQIGFRRHGDLHGRWDGERVAQVVANLLGNAISHGGDPIAVEADGSGERVRVAVSNGGAPIPEDRRATLFEPFRRGGDSTGIGLGLFIAREIVRAHGGTIEASSGEAGTVFTTWWPRAAAR
jgi:signal transduction histidine kinase